MNKREQNKTHTHGSVTILSMINAHSPRVVVELDCQSVNTNLPIQVVIRWLVALQKRYFTLQRRNLTRADGLESSVSRPAAKEGT